MLNFLEVFLNCYESFNNFTVSKKLKYTENTISLFLLNFRDVPQTPSTNFLITL